jgi:hypothetical protein
LRSLSSLLELILSAYAATMRGLVGWAELPLQDALTWLGSSIGWRPTLYPHWSDMFVVVAILTTALVSARWRDFVARWNAAGHDGLFGFGHIIAFSFAFLVLTAGGLLMVVITGILPLRSVDLLVQLVIATSSWIIFGIAMWFGGIMKRNEAMGVLVFAGIAALTTWWLSQAVGSASGLGIAGFAVSVIVVGIVYLVFGVALTLSGKPFATSPGIYGVYILGGFVNAGVLLVIDAGVRWLFG